VKEYHRMLVKWIPAAVASARAYRYLLSPRARMANEHRYFRLLRGVVETPRVLVVCADQARAAMARSFVEGDPVLSTRDPSAWEASGEALARVHGAGHVLGDPNPGNFVYRGGGVAVIDAEQASRYTPVRAAWDLAVYTVYALLFGAPEELVARGLEAYARSAPRAREVAAAASRPGFWAPLAPLGPLAVKARRLVASALRA